MAPETTVINLDRGALIAIVAGLLASNPESGIGGLFGPVIEDREDPRRWRAVDRRSEAASILVKAAESVVNHATGHTSGP